MYQRPLFLVLFFRGVHQNQVNALCHDSVICLHNYNYNYLNKKDLPFVDDILSSYILVESSSPLPNKGSQSVLLMQIKCHACPYK